MNAKPYNSGGRLSADRSAGFTLLELIVVVVVVAIISSAVIPMFADSLRSLRRQRYIDDFTTAMKYAQERAVSGSVEHRVFIDDEENAFWVERLDIKLEQALGTTLSGAPFLDSQRDVLPKAEFVPVDDAPGRKTYLPETLSFATVKASKDKERKAFYIAFYPSGSCDAATVKIAKGKRASMTIETEGRLGPFKITEKGRGE
jgi:prepilin-type N-terminal cleavage/methylation domain-containing protein